MEDIPVYTSQMVNEQEIAAWRRAVEEAIEYRQRKDALLLSQAIARRLPVAMHGDRDSYQRLQHLKSQADFMALPLLDNKEVVTLFRDHLDDVLSTDIDLWDQIRFKLITLIPDDRDAFKMELKAALEQCQRPVSVLPRVFADGRKEPGTMANWLKDFRSFMEGKMTDTLKSTEFFTKNATLRSLPENDQNKLKMLLTIYQWFHHSTFDIDGFEGSLTLVETDGTTKILENGTFTTIRPAAKKSAGDGQDVKQTVQAAAPIGGIPVKDPMQMLRQKYAKYRSSRQRVLDIEDNVLVATKGEPQAIYHELSVAVQKGDKYKATACLKILARERALVDALRENPSWWESTAEYMTQKYTGRYPAPEVKLAVSNLKLDPTVPSAVSEFLQFVLKVRLKIGDTEAALIGVEIGQLLGGEYQSMAYGNAETGEFEWVKNKIADRKLVGEIG